MDSINKTAVLFFCLVFIGFLGFYVIQAEAADEPPTELYVRTTPEGAKVFLDDKEVGVTPGLFKVEPGKAKIVVKLEGRDPVEREVEIHASKITRLELEFKNQTSTAADDRDKTTDAKKVHVPWAKPSNSDVGVVLDFASGQLLKIPDPTKKGPSQFTILGKGDLVFGQNEIGCLRGGTIMRWNGTSFFPYQEEKIGEDEKKNLEDAKVYVLPTAPCRLLITTAEKKQFDVTILSIDEDGGIDLEYRPADAKIKYKQGIESAKNGRYEEAIASFQAALMLKPDYAEAHNDLGLALAETGRLAEAIEHYRQALRLKPDYAEVYNNLGADLEKMGRIQQAMENYRVALKLKPDYAEAKKNLAAVMDKLKHSEEPNGPRPSLSEKASDESAATKPAPDAHKIIKNPGIESGDKAPEDWQQGAAIEGVKYSWDKKVAFEGKASLCIEKTANRYFPIAQWSQTVRREGDKPVLLVSAQVKAKNMTKAVLDVLFLDDQDNWISHQWIAYIGAKEEGDPPANHDWKLYSGKADIPPNTAKICVGLQDYGPGKVWFDNVRAEYAK